MSSIMTAPATSSYLCLFETLGRFSPGATQFAGDIAPLGFSQGRAQ